MYFGIQWLPFERKNSPYVYQTLGTVATSFCRELGIVGMLYIDDRLTGEIFAMDGHWSRAIALPSPTFSYESAKAVLYVVCRLVIGLGYFIGLDMCVLDPKEL